MEEQAEFQQLSDDIQELQQSLNQDFRQKTVSAVFVDRKPYTAASSSQQTWVRVGGRRAAWRRRAAAPSAGQSHEPGVRAAERRGRGRLSPSRELPADARPWLIASCEGPGVARGEGSPSWPPGSVCVASSDFSLTLKKTFFFFGVWMWRG